MTELIKVEENLRETNIKRANKGRWRILLKTLILSSVVVVSVYVLRWTPLCQYLHDMGAAQETLQRTGAASPIIFMLITAVLVAVGVPRLLLCPIGGAVFGFTWGLILTQAATLCGYYVTFLFVRWGGGDWVTRRWPRLRKWAGYLERFGVPAVFVIRQLPVSGLVINIVLALAAVRHSSFLVGTVLGILPEAIPATLIGSGATEWMSGHGVLKIAAAVVGLLIIWLVTAEFVRRMRTKDRIAADVVAD